MTCKDFYVALIQYRRKPRLAHFSIVCKAIGMSSGMSQHASARDGPEVQAHYATLQRIDFKPCSFLHIQWKYESFLCTCTCYAAGNANI